MTDEETEREPVVSRRTVRRREGGTARLLWVGLALVVILGLLWLLPFGLF